jgi:hypothetical protein
MFEEATRKKYRFDYKGLLDVEDLWDLKVTDLDIIYKGLKSNQKEATEDSLLNTRSTADVVLDDKIAIVTHIVHVKQEEKNARLEAKERKEQKQELLGIIKEQENEELRKKSPEELRKIYEEL